MSAHAVKVELATCAYEVRIGRGVLAGVPEAARTLFGPKAARVLLVRDTGVPERFESALVSGLKTHGFDAKVCSVTPSESIKTIETVERLLVEAARAGLTRVDAVVALGGGVVGDIAGYVAASYQRGIPVIQCPSTLLSMVDASVGGKTGVNLSVDGELYKNMVGAFHQPAMVIADTELLDSLDPRHFRCGLAECVKHAMICKSVPDPDQVHLGLLDWISENRQAIMDLQHSVIDELVARNVALKASVVMSDERESPEAKAGGRMLLNLGHTFGHAIETLEGISPTGDPADAPLHHGEAVALGTVCACAAAESQGVCSTDVRETLTDLLRAFGLPIQVAGLPSVNEIIERMGHDKKAAGGSLRVILPEARGVCRIVSDPDPSDLAAGIRSIGV